MGVTIIHGVKKGQTPSGAVPPYAVSGGDATQPCLFVTYKTGTPKLVASIQLVNKRQGKIVIHAHKGVIESYIEEFLTFFGPVTDVAGAAPAPGSWSSSSKAPRLTARQLLAQVETVQPQA